jgi:tryptophan synthase alpha subunit
MRALEPHADGLVVGSAIVAAARDGGAAAVGELVATLRG